MKEIDTKKMSVQKTRATFNKKKWTGSHRRFVQSVFNWFMSKRTKRGCI